MGTDEVSVSGQWVVVVSRSIRDCGRSDGSITGLRREAASITITNQSKKWHGGPLMVGAISGCTLIAGSLGSICIDSI